MASHASGETVSVELQPDNGKRRYVLRGKITHSSSSDFGLYLPEDMPSEVFHRLIEARSTLPRPGGDQDSLFPEESQSIMRDGVNMFRVFLGDVWQELLAKIRIKVADSDTDQLPLGERSRYLNALADLRMRADEVSRQHFEMLVERMQKIGEIEENTAPSSEDELSIVDENSFQDWLNISRVFNRIEEDNRSAMVHFAQRFGRLTPVPFGPRNDPFGPQALCLTFQEAVRPLDFNNTMRAILYRLLGEILQPNYPAFYERLNRLLAPLRPIVLHAEKAPDTTGRRTEAEAVAVEPEPHPQEDEAAKDRIEQQVTKLADIAERLFNLYPPLATATEPQAAAATAEPVRSTQPPAPTQEAPVSGMEASALQLQQMLGFIAGRTQETPTRAPATFGQGSPAGVTADQIEGLFARVGATQAATAPAPNLSTRIGQMLSRPEFADQLPASQREELGVMANLLSRALAEHGSQSDIDLFLKKLEKPIYDLALLGEAPPRLETHPLGRLINLVDQFAVVATDAGQLHDPKLKDLVESVLDKALGQQDREGNSLEAACTALEKLLKYPMRHRKQMVSGYQEICEAKERIRDCNHRVIEELNGRFSGKTIPRIVTELLESGWQQLLVLIRLRDDETDWAQAWHVLDNLIAESEQAAGGEIDTTRPQLFDSIESRLEKVNIDRRQVAELMSELAAYLRDPAQAERVQVPKGWFKLAESPADRSKAPNEALLNQLRIGDWWDIKHDGRTVPMQLIWLSHPPGISCFVNRSADRKQDLPLAELSALIESNQAKPGESRDLPLLERSEYGTVDAMYRRLVQQANHDPVTSLPNRKYLIHQVDRDSHLDSVNSFCVIGFEPYQLIFDNCGVGAGEELTRSLAAVVQRNLGANDRLAVIGEGRFAVFLPGSAIQSAREFAARLGRSFEGFRFQHEKEHFSIHAFFGLSSYLPGFMEPAEAMRQGVSAYEVARSIGPNTVQLFEDSDSRIHNRETIDSWAGQIDEMLSGDRLFLRCQKIAPLQETDAPPYYEILLGVLDKSGTQISPQPFVLAVERWNRAQDLDGWVFGRVVDWIRKNRAEFEQTGGFSINLSAQSLSSADLLGTLHRELSSGDLPCEKITFEITETAALQSYAIAEDFMRQIRRYGCRFSMDDFGSGNASFSYLRSLRTDTLKIDGAYVMDLADDPELQAMVKSMNEIGHALGMKTVAEFVATPEILVLIKEIGIDYAQGYEVEKPMHIDNLLPANGSRQGLELVK